MDLTTILKGYEQRLERVAQQSVADLTNRVVIRTPVLTGKLRKSWAPGIGSIRLSNGGITNAAGASRALKIGQNFYLVNCQPYARRIEYEGWSSKAPGGMLRISVAEWQPIVTDAARASGGG